MAKILCLDTTTTNCSVTLSENGKILATKENVDQGYSHAEKLHLYIEAVLLHCKWDKQELDAVAVSMGPGSYTGLRIGVSAAKGLCFALEIPLIAIPTLQSLACKVPIFKYSYIVPMLDARRMEVYSAVFSGAIESIRETKAEVLTETSFLEYLEKGTVIFLGNGVEKFRAICHHPKATFLEKELPSSKQMASLAFLKYEKNDFADLAYFEPYYLKDFITTKAKG